MEVSAIELSVIIINWNSKAYLLDCLKSLYNDSSGLNFETIVIDNASYDGVKEVLQNFPDVIFVQSDENLGFARANNLAARKAAGETLLFLNPDTIIDKKALLCMYSALWSKNTYAIAGPILLNGDRSIQTSCILPFPTIVRQLFDSDVFVKSNRIWNELRINKTNARQVEAVSGASLMIKKNIFDRVNGFSECYFMYAEDIDLCYKAKKLGGGTILVPVAEVIHFGGGSSKKQYTKDFVYINQRQATYQFMRQNYGMVYGILYKIVIAHAALVRIFLMPAYFFPNFKGISGGVRKWWSILGWAVGLRKGA